LIRKNMKKAMAFILAMTLAFSLAACGGGDVGDGGDTTASPPDPAPPPLTAAVGDLIEFGGYEWRVLEVSGGKALLLSEKVLEWRAYQNDGSSATWAQSDMRAYLNGEFYDSFSASDRARIAETYVITDDNPWFYTQAMASGDDLWVQDAPRGGADTYDRIFLLSLEEVARCFGDSGQLAGGNPGSSWYISDRYDSARIAYTAVASPWGDPANTSWWWWLRSPGYAGNYAAGVYYGGIVYVYGYYAVARGGVRPAMWVNLD
jgi:hypothetical protein